MNAEPCEMSDDDVAEFRRFVEEHVASGFDRRTLRVRPEAVEHLPTLDGVTWLVCTVLEEDGMQFVAYETEAQKFWPHDPSIWVKA